MGHYSRKEVISWALYDWANSAYATTVMAGFFPLFFKNYWSTGSEVTSNFQLGAANSVSSLLIVAFAPVLGAIADRGSMKKRLLFFFAALGVLMTGSLYLVAQGEWLLAAAVFVVGSIGYSGANIFYDSLLISVAPESKRDFVSGLGFSLGYLGGGLLFAFNVIMTMQPAWFGLSGVEEAVKLSFLSVAGWWAIFSVPILLFVDEPARGPRPSRVIRAGLRQLKATFEEIRRLRTVLIFLVGYWLYIDGVDTIVRMAIAYGDSLGFDSGHLVAALLITQFVGFPAALAFGKLGEKLGPRTGIFICIGVYIVVTTWGVFIDSSTDFYVLAVAIGLVQGGIQSLSRSYYARLIPQNKAAEFYGFYNMLGKFAAVIGPLLMGALGYATGSPRISILSLLLLFILGGTLLYFVDEEEGRRAARELEQI